MRSTWGVIMDSLVQLSIEHWTNLQKEFKSDWPSGISGYTVLETQRRWAKERFNYGFKVFCPYGDVKNGMVALNQKNNFYEIIIQSPTDNTESLEKALKTTKEIDWKRKIIIPFAPNNVIECVKRVVNHIHVKIELILPSESFILKKETELFRNVDLPSTITFGHLTHDHLDLVNSTWPHRYPESEWYFDLLLKTKSGFGLFENHVLISWVFINEVGTLGHMYTLEEHRRKGYAELLLKIVANILLEDGKDVFAFAVKGNQSACRLYKKLGFENYEAGVAWCYLGGTDVG